VTRAAHGGRAPEEEGRDEGPDAEEMEELVGLNDEIEYTGYDLVLHRTTNIMRNIAETNMTKVLQVHGGEGNERFLELLGKSRVFDISIISDKPEIIHQVKSKVQYHTADVVDFADVKSDNVR